MCIAKARSGNNKDHVNVHADLCIDHSKRKNSTFFHHVMYKLFVRLNYFSLSFVHLIFPIVFV